MSEVLVLVLAQPGSAAEDAAREARAQACPRPFEVRVVDAAGPPGAAIEAALQATSAPLVALLDASAPPEAGWLAALVAALDQDASLGAAAGSLGPGRHDATRRTLSDGDEAHARFVASLDDLCRLPTASCAFRREAWEDVRLDTRAPAGEVGPLFARALLEAGWALLEVPTALVRWTGPQPPGPRWERVIFPSPPDDPQPRPAAAALTSAAKLARTAARVVELFRDQGPLGVLQRLRDRARPERPWHEQLPWSLLAEPTPLHLPPRPEAAHGPLRINWVVPAFYAGSGGHMTIFRLVRHLEERGHRCKILFTSTEGLLPSEGVRLRALVRRHFQPIAARCLAFAGHDLPEADVHVATHWDTALVVDRKRRRGAGAYLVQDWEPSFYPAGTRAAVAEATYGLGLQHVTAGPWLAARLRERGAAAAAFDLAVDADDYFVEPGLAPPPQGRIAVYFRPLTERRGFEVLALALAEVAARRPALEFVAYGSAADELVLPFAAKKPGVLRTSALRQLYCESTIGLSCSLTNHSLVPQEMWACGLPVVEIDGESTRAVYRDGEDVVLAPLEPRALAARILSLLDDAALRQRLRDHGLARAAALNWRRSAEQVETGLRLAVARALSRTGG